ncbi:substrate-binding domain-containing protein [Paludisphaera soli]|uniref:substrate-binding domain-containing protein n=1 Tax=Paludisphaera soli TaxID=2712865 RepID=UPI0013EA2940|nr:substrate-binding domain-containing protein [Paludisphaera soli]
MTRLGFAGMSPRRRVLGLVGTACWLAATGCEGPAPPPSRSRPATVAGQGVKTLELIPAPKLEADLDFVKGAARIQAGLDTIRVLVADPSATSQAELVRQGLKRAPGYLLVEAPAEPDAELAAAVGEARAKGVAIVALGRSLGGPEGGPGREIVVAPRPFAESAKEIVGLAVRNAGNGKVDPKSGAVILAETPSDPLIGDRIAALKDALKAAGVAEVGELRTGRDSEAAQAALLDFLKAHPGTNLVIAADGVGVQLAEDVAGAVQDDRAFVIAGYSPDESGSRSQVQVGEYAAIGIYAPDRLVRKGINVAAKLLRGEKVADRVEIENSVMASPVESGLAKGRPATAPKKPVAPE